MPSSDLCNVITFLLSVLPETIISLWQTFESLLSCILYKNRLFCWLKLVATLTYEVLYTLVMAGVTLCVCTYFMLTEPEIDEPCRKMQTNICEMLRCTDICSIIARNKCACECGTCGKTRLPFVNDCDMTLVENCELPNVFDAFNASDLLGEDMYCFEKCGRAHDSLNNAMGYHKCGYSSLKKNYVSDSDHKKVEFSHEVKK